MSNYFNDSDIEEALEIYAADAHDLGSFLVANVKKAYESCLKK